MTRRRWIADEVSGNTAALTGEHAAHLVRVLRAEIGQEFDIATGDAVRRGTVTNISNDRVEFALGEEQPIKPTPQITLALAIFKFDRMEWAIEKCTEIGVARIIPVIARRTEAHLAAAAVRRQERWQRIALQAAEQSRRPAPAEIASPVKLSQLAELNATCRIVLFESEKDATLRDALQSRPTDVTLAIGPEGGWTADEFQWFRDSGWIAASLGDNILRAETAAIVSAAIALDALR
jgi:16S rRNA (uracil1498-N3)-methyltransferase